MLRSSSTSAIVAVIGWFSGVGKASRTGVRPKFAPAQSNDIGYPPGDNVALIDSHFPECLRFWNKRPRSFQFGRSRRLFVTERMPRHGLDAMGIGTGATLYWNLITAPLVEHAVRRGEGKLAKDGPLVVATGKHTGRSAKDKFIVRDATTEDSVWWGDVNKAMSPEHFAALKADFMAEVAKRDTLFVQDLYGGSQPEHRVNVRVINELAWHSLFIRTRSEEHTSELQSH